MALETLQDIVESFPHKGRCPAIISLTKDDRETLTYANLSTTARRLAWGLSKAGLKPRTLALVMAPNQPEWIMTIWALVMTGAIPVPIDAQMQGPDLRHICSDSQPRWIFTTTSLVHSLDFLNPDDSTLVLLDVDRQDPKSWQQYLCDEPVECPRASPEEQAIMFYTSGTSGRPKGVPLSHRNLVSNLDALLQLNVIHDDDRLLVPLPLHHVYPFMAGMLAPLTVGIPLILPFALTGPQLRRALRDPEPTAIIGIPRLYEVLKDALETRLRQQGALLHALTQTAILCSTMLRRYVGFRVGPSLFAKFHQRFAPRLRTLVSGGAPLSPELAWQLEGLGWQVGTGYGLTETSPILTLNEPGTRYLHTAGRPLPGVELKIAPKEKDTEEGEVLVKGPNVFAGYYNLPDKTNTAFTEEGYFRTGDLGYVRDGFLYLGGRASSMIVLSGGENVRPDVIEETLNQTPHVQETGVLAVDNKLVAVIVPTSRCLRGRNDSEITSLVRREVEQQSRHLPSHHRLADYAISSAPLPRTRLGKLRRHLLGSVYQQAKQQHGIRPASGGPLPIEHMSSDDQHLLSYPQAHQAWEWLSTRFPDVRLTPDSNVQFDLGMDSLEWVTVTLDIQETLGIELDQETIHRIESVRELLQLVIDAKSSSGSEVCAALRRDPERLLDENQQAWFASQNTMMQQMGTFLFRINRVLMRHVYGLTILGMEHLPQKGPLVITPNHASLLDPPALAAAFSEQQLEQTYWGGWTDMMFRNMLMRVLSRALRVLPIDPAKSPFSNLAVGATILKQGRMLVWFPEGERSDDGTLQSFRSGIGHLLEAQRVPVVPAWISGTYTAWPRHTRWPGRGQITVRFGKPQSARTLEERGTGSHTPQKIVDALYHEISQLSEEHRDDLSPSTN